MNEERSAVSLSAMSSPSNRLMASLRISSASSRARSATWRAELQQIANKLPSLEEKLERASTREPTRQRALGCNDENNLPMCEAELERSEKKLATATNTRNFTYQAGVTRRPLSQLITYSLDGLREHVRASTNAKLRGASRLSRASACLRRQAGMPILGLFGGLKIGAELGWGRAIFTDNMVCFNGRPQYEPLTIPRSLESSGDAGEYGLFWDGAKTNQLPCDRLVIAVLLALKHHFPESALYSDGNRDDWAAGIYLCEHATARPAPAFADLGKPSRAAELNQAALQMLLTTGGRLSFMAIDPTARTADRSGLKQNAAATPVTRAGVVPVRGNGCRSTSVSGRHLLLIAGT